MIKKELLSHYKGFLICLLVLVGMFLMVYVLYPFLINEETTQAIEELMKMMPEDILKSFNMDMSSIATAYGWLKSEGFVYVLITVGIYSSILGANIVLKEEIDKTSEYLSFLPIKRNHILTNKIIVSLIYIFGMIIAFTLFNYAGLSISGKFDVKEFLLLSVSPLLTAVPLFFISLFISTLVHRNKRIVGLSLLIVLVSYVLNAVSEISDKAEALKYLSIYTLSDVRGIITNCKINYICIIVSVGISFVFLVLSYIKYNRKELV